MGLGVLEDRAMEHVPGTTRYFDDPERPQFAADGPAPAHGLKCDTSGPVPIILVPQPSDDPNDPLNWPLWQRDLICLVLSVTAIFATALGPILAANTLTLSLWFVTDFTHVALLTGWFLLGVGVTAFLFVPTGRIWGKRHLFILGLCMLIGSSAWAGAVWKNYHSMVGARIVQGVGCAPFESLVNAAVGDLYFVHQRGKRMAFTNLAVFGGAFFTPIVVGKITHTIMWWWTFYLVAIFCAVCLPAVIFLCPETAFRRDARLNTDMLSGSESNSQVTLMSQPTGPAPQAEKNEAHPGPEMLAPAEKPRTSGGSGIGNGADTPAPNVEAAQPRAVPQKVSYWQSLALFNGRKTDDAYWKLLLRPLVLLAHPAFLWATLIQGTMIGWTVFIGVILAQFFIGPPLFWNEVKTGYAYTGPFIGALVGFLIAGGLADWSAKWMTKKNKGIYEPEFRILLVIPQLIFGCMGVYGFGITADGIFQSKYHWSVPIVFFAFEVCGMVIGAVASSLYIVDAYRDLAIEGFTAMIIFKNFFSFGLTWKAYDWILENQSRGTPVFNALGSVQLVVCLLSIPMYVFGKRIRSYFHRHDILDMCGLR